MEVILKIDELKPSPSNVRTTHTPEDIEMMAQSILHRGIINPPTVAKNGDGRYEVVAGLLRYKGALKAGIEEIRCFDVTAYTDAERVEISLAENIDRRQMSAIEYYRAFNQLFKAGMGVTEIASRFGKTDREVQQLLAIGSLPKKLLDLADAGEIGDRTLKILAIAPRSDVSRYLKLPKGERPSEWQVSNWLAGNDGMYRAEVALFDHEDYKGATIFDLFAEDKDEIWYTDGGLFWELQNEAINKELARLVGLEWECQKLEFFQEWMYDKAAKADGGKVYYTVSPKTGAVEFHKGYKPRPKAGGAPAAKATGEKEAKPEISQAFSRYMDATRNLAVKRQMIDNRESGLVGTLILLLKQADNIRFSTGNASLADAYAQSITKSNSFQILRSDFQAMLDDLELKDGSLWSMNTMQTACRMREYKPTVLIRWIILTVTYLWEIHGTGEDSDALAKAFDLNEVTDWKADATFWDGIKNKQTLQSIAKDNGVDVADAEPAKVIRSRLERKIPEDWRPKWLKF